MNFSRIIAEAVNTPWAILDSKFDAIVSLLALRTAGGELSEADIRAAIGDRVAHREPYLVAEDGVRISLAEYEAHGPLSAAAGGNGSKPSGKLVAVLPVYGVIGHRMNGFDAISGGTSVEKLTAQFRAAVANPDIKAIVLDFDSPGGSVYGIDELASEIFAAREQKKVVAQINPLAASAAYYLASQASEIAIMPSGEAGSIGVRMMHQDMSKALEQRGIKVTHISAGKHKVEGNPFEPLAEEAQAFMQQRVNEYYDPFIAAVARGRDVKKSEVKEGFGEGRVLGAVEAKRLGMVDRIATLDDTLARLGAAANGNRVALAAQSSAAPVAAQQADVTTATAESQEVHPMDTNATTAAAAADSQDRDRCAKIAQVAAANHIAADKVTAWIASGATLESVQQEILTTMRPVPVPVPAQAAAREADPAKGPFRSFGEQMLAIAMAGKPGGHVDPRLFKVHELQAAATGANTSVPSDGGFLVQTDFSTEIFRRTYETGALASRCSRTGIGENSDSLEVPYVDETTRATGSRWGGVRVSRAGETDDVTAGKVKLGKWECRLEDLKGRAYVTDRQLRDGASLTGVLNEAMSDEFAFVLDDEIFSGDGAGKCLGIIKSAALATVAKEAGQAAGTVVAENITNMWARCWGRSRQNAVWFYNQELDAQLPLMNVGIGTGGALIFMPPGGLSGSPFGTLYGRPLIPIEQAFAPGDVGDIVLADMSQYKLIDKDGIQSASSIHVRFVNDETCFKFNMRVNGAPKWKTALTPYRGTAGKTLSPFVALAKR